MASDRPRQAAPVPASMQPDPSGFRRPHRTTRAGLRGGTRRGWVGEGRPSRPLDSDPCSLRTRVSSSSPLCGPLREGDEREAVVTRLRRDRRPTALRGAWPARSTSPPGSSSASDPRRHHQRPEALTPATASGPIGPATPPRRAPGLRRTPHAPGPRRTPHAQCPRQTPHAAGPRRTPHAPSPRHTPHAAGQRHTPHPPGSLPTPPACGASPR